MSTQPAQKMTSRKRKADAHQPSQTAPASAPAPSASAVSAAAKKPRRGRTSTEAAPTPGGGPRHWHNDGNENQQSSRDLMFEWLKDPDNLDILRHGAHGKSRKDGAQILSDYMKVNGQDRSFKAIQGEFKRLLDGYKAAETWNDGTGNGQGEQLRRGAQTEEEEVEIVKTCRAKCLELCPEWDELHPILANKVGGTASLRTHTGADRDPTFEGMRDARRAKSRAWGASDPAPASSAPSPSHHSFSFSRDGSEASGGAPRYDEMEEGASEEEERGRAGALGGRQDRSSPLGEVSLSDKKKRKRRSKKTSDDDSDDAGAAGLNEEEEEGTTAFLSSEKQYQEAKEVRYQEGVEREKQRQEAETQYRNNMLEVEKKRLEAEQRLVDIKEKKVQAEQNKEVKAWAEELKADNPDMSFTERIKKAREMMSG